MGTHTRPDYCTDEMLSFLDGVRETNMINMYAAGPLLRDSFDLDKQQAKEVILYWMDSYEERNKDGEDDGQE